MEKQPAWAAATSSSGLVPIPFSKRVPNEYWVWVSTPLSVETLPFPSLRLPCHTAEAFRFMSSSSVKVNDSSGFACIQAANRNCCLHDSLDSKYVESCLNEKFCYLT